MRGCLPSHCPQLTEARLLGWQIQAGLAVLSHTLTKVWACRRDPVPSHPIPLQAWQTVGAELWPLELLLISLSSVLER